LPLSSQQSISQSIAQADTDDNAFRIVPNVTAGWALASRTRIYSNYFMIRDTFFRNHQLNSTAHSIAGGIQQDIPIGSKANLQADFQFREFFARHSQPSFDFLPSLTFS